MIRGNVKHPITILDVEIIIYIYITVFKKATARQFAKYKSKRLAYRISCFINEFPVFPRLFAFMAADVKR